MSYETGLGRGRALVEGGDLRRPHVIPSEVNLIAQQNDFLQNQGMRNHLANNIGGNPNFADANARNIAAAQIRAASEFIQNQSQNINANMNQSNIGLIRADHPSLQAMPNLQMHALQQQQLQAISMMQQQQQQQQQQALSSNLILGGNIATHDQIANDFSNMQLASAVGQGNSSLHGAASTLSPEAPEFVPRFSEPGSVTSNSQQQAHMMQNIQSPSPNLQYLNHPVILQVNNIVVTLTMKPHKFDQIANQLTTILSYQVKEVGLMKEVIEVMFEQGVGEANFRFNGGRLMQHLSKNSTQSYNGPSFKSLLLGRCCDEFNFRDYYLQSDPKRLCGFTLYLSDIFSHLVTPQSQPIEKIREALCNLLISLMSNPTTMNLKCVVQVLKCSGRTLDSPNSTEMDHVMDRLKDLAFSSAAAAGHIKDMLLSVIELRAANWGRTPGDVEGEDGHIQGTSEVPSQILGTVYYGPGGVVQRIERDDAEDSASDTDDSLCYGNAENDLEGEVAVAFEEFLRSQHQ